MIDLSPLFACFMKVLVALEIDILVSQVQEALYALLLHPALLNIIIFCHKTIHCILTEAAYCFLYCMKYFKEFRYETVYMCAGYAACMNG